MKALRAFGRSVAGILRELSDENAYARHLAAHGRKHSREEWQHFCNERFRAKYTKPKCC